MISITRGHLSQIGRLCLNSSHISTHVCPFALTPPRAPGRSWAAPTGVLSVTCQTKRAAEFSELCWDQEWRAFPCLPGPPELTPSKNSRVGGGKNDMKPGVADPWFHTQFTES